MWKTVPTLLGPPTQAPGFQPEALPRAPPTVMAPGEHRPPLQAHPPSFPTPAHCKLFSLGNGPCCCPMCLFPAGVPPPGSGSHPSHLHLRISFLTLEALMPHLQKLPEQPNCTTLWICLDGGPSFTCPTLPVWLFPLLRALLSLWPLRARLPLCVYPPRPPYLCSHILS